MDEGPVQLPSLPRYHLSGDGNPTELHQLGWFCHPCCLARYIAMKPKCWSLRRTAS